MLYQHYKGEYYLTLCRATHTESKEDMIVYYNIKDKNKVWVRPADMFFEDVEVDGIIMPRFRRVEIPEDMVIKAYEVTEEDSDGN